MSDRVNKLLILQDRLLAHRKIQDELAKMPRDRERLKAQIAADGEKLERHRQEAKAIEVERKKIELEVEAKQQLIGKYKSQQMQTRKNEEYQALTHEIERAEQDIVTMEDRELELMEAYDKALKDVAAEEEAFKAVETANNEKLAAFDGREGNLKDREVEAAAEAKQAEEGIEDKDLRLFHRILESKKDIAIVPIRHDICQGCHMRVTHQTVIQTHSKEGIPTCDNCGRILYDGD